MRDETIAAIATSTSGVGGIGVIRISGEHSESICRSLFRPRKETSHYESHRLYHGDIVDADRDVVIDEGLVALMRGPHSYTGEDVLEISCHGNPLILRTVLDLALKAGARIAEPGEFTKRAFLNGRIDLAQAEAVADLIAVRTERGLQQALCSLRGGLSDAIGSIRTSLLDVLAVLETSIDFTEEDIALPDTEAYADRLEEAALRVADLLATYEKGVLYRDGITAVIAGRPNVGKSSLLNRLAGEERAIVTAEPGTTRDFIETDVKIGDLTVRFVDTAGLRESDHHIEREGVRYARKRADEADLVLVVLDGSQALSPDDRHIIEEFHGKNLLILVNKCDMPVRLTNAEIEAILPGSDPLFLSVKENQGMDELRHRIAREYAPDGSENDAMLTNLRHREALEDALSCLGRAGNCLKEGVSPELTALETGEALRCLALVSGEGVEEDVLDVIFSRFCVGK